VPEVPEDSILAPVTKGGAMNFKVLGGSMHLKVGGGQYGKNTKI